MPLHIEISGDCSPQEWRALAALTSVMLGTSALTPTVAPSAIPDATPSLPAVPLPPAAGADDDAPAGEALPPVTPPGVVVDSTGLPWDGRIHASTKTQTKKGAWITKRGIDENLVKHVEAELRAVMAAPAVTPALGAVPPPPVDVPANLDPAAAFGGTTPAPAVVPPPADAPALAPMAEFARVMREITARQTAGTLATETVVSVAQSLGLTGAADLAKRPDLIPAFEALLP